MNWSKKMSLYDYKMSIKIDAEDYPFYALLMALMRKADDGNAAKLRLMFSDVWRELFTRYNSPGGYLPEELEAQREEKKKLEEELTMFDSQKDDLPDVG
jgi:hypothetical protein